VNVAPAAGVAADIAVGFAFLCACLGSWEFLLSLANSLWLFSTTRVKPLRSGKKISVLVPARNEAAHIEACIGSLLSQNYGDYEILVYDDDSTDGSGAILDRLAAGAPDKLRVIHGGLEAGWYGKPHAMQVLSERATGAWLLFTDADSVHSPDSLGRAMALAVAYRADLVSGYALHRVDDFGRARVVPAIYLLTMLGVPLWLVHRTKSPAISHAIGQFMFFEAEGYRRLGGYGAVRDRVSEDVRIARLVKRSGGRVLFADLKAQVSCSMYDDYRSAVDGISKNVFDYFDKNAGLLAAATVAVPLFAFVPLVGSIWLPPALAGAQVWFRIDVFLSFGAWAIVAWERRLPWYLPLISPLVLTSALSAGWRAFRLFGEGKAVLWKGRMVK
jgi:chlorobactene glucosyltransferase